MEIEIWSDVVCPWCYIGKRRLETALGEFDHSADVHITWRSFQLDPSVPAGSRAGVYEHLATKLGRSTSEVRAMTDQVRELGAAEGLDYDFEHSIMVNTFNAHRLAHLARAHELGSE